jgi:hypothetical protein
MLQELRPKMMAVSASSVSFMGISFVLPATPHRGMGVIVCGVQSLGASLLQLKNYGIDTG